ncbi:NAD(P)-dependent oxidoreductase [Pseudosulfitobacter sp. DSM 107133]|uniref:NAD(P)-dependent oxidoreductase n=1 Tax=Pseudosulfitobacter sp. DSM 107133 TaxID=2883100 RepID=UPI000DF122EB|nr:NAD(P)-dependent oxidoreductase [Pseudosulfitobacter sp. DSM 107133]UOA26262.1 2-hydroxy-3-oxopropionate reductase [Pseudosulfitobacter sp. DSM 107133]
MSKPGIGFIGLGLMGNAMVQRLLDQGYELTVMANRSRPHVDAAIARGAREVQTARAVAQASDIVMLCMDTSASVESRMRGDDGVIAGLSRDAVVIDFGTSLPASTKALAQEVAAKGATYLDAPLGRTPAHAEKGQLNIMAAGDEAAFARVKPVLADLGENVFHLGPVGSGHTIKLMNNFFGMTVASAMAEAFAMADLAGIDRKGLYDVMSAGPLHSGMMDFVKGYAVDGDPDQLAFAIKNAAKDVGYYSQMTRDLNAASVMSGATKAALDSAVDQGMGDQMVSQMTDYFAQQFKRD